MELISVQCPHCGAALPPREPCGRYECDYCGTGFRAKQAPAAKTQAGIDVSQEAFRRMIAEANRREVQRRFSGQRKTRGSGGAGCMLVLGLAIMIAAAGGVAMIFLTDGMDDPSPPTTPNKTAESSPVGPMAEPPTPELPITVTTLATAPTGMAPSALAELDKNNRSWNEVDSTGIVGSLASFDPIANLDWALRTARYWAPDVRLTRIGVARVRPDGTVELTGRDSVDYRFYSPARRAAELELAKVSDETLPTEFRIMVRRNEVEVMQSSRTVPDRKPGPPALVATCSLASLLSTWKEKHGLPLRPHYRLTVYRSGSRYRWNIDTGRVRAKRSMPPLKPDGCDPAAAKQVVPEAVGREDFQTLTHCECKGDQPVQLAVRVVSTSSTVASTGTTVERDLDYMIDVGEGSHRLPTSPEMAPPSKTTGSFHLGMVCHGDRLVVLSGDRMTAWSTTKRLMVWNQKLPSAYSDITPAGGGFSIGCRTMKHTKGRSLRIRLKDGTRVRVNVESGKITKR